MWWRRHSLSIRGRTPDGEQRLSDGNGEHRLQARHHRHDPAIEQPDLRIALRLLDEDPGIPQPAQQADDVEVAQVSVSPPRVGEEPSRAPFRVSTEVSEPAVD